VLLLDEETREDVADLQIESLARGVIQLEHAWPTLGDVRNHLRVLKVRSVPFRGGYHDFVIETGGLLVYPRLRVADHRAEFAPGMASTGLPELDTLLGGGLDRGSTTLLVGPTGAGKSVVASQLAVAAADRGEHVALFVFDEVLDAMFARADGLGIGLREHARSGRIAVHQVDPGELAPWQFGRMVLRAVERDRARVVVIDSVNGYLNAMPDERALDLALHELFGCLSQLGTITVGTLVQYGILGERRTSAVDVSYLSDTVVLFSLFEAAGELRKAIGVVKRRRGAHERGVRELHIGPVGLRIGEPLRDLQGVLTSAPRYVVGGPPAEGR
jgi:circadian clock protein KaiC